MRARIRHIDGLYLHKNGGWTNKENAALIQLPRAEKVVKRLVGCCIAVDVELDKANDGRKNRER